jgi:hypothetical protein
VVPVPLAISRRKEIIGTRSPLNLWPFAETYLSVANLEVAMAAIPKVLSRGQQTTRTALGIVKQLALFGCAGAFVSLLMMTHGLDLSPGFF